MERLNNNFGPKSLHACQTTRVAVPMSEEFATASSTVDSPGLLLRSFRVFLKRVSL